MDHFYQKNYFINQKYIEEKYFLKKYFIIKNYFDPHFKRIQAYDAEAVVVEGVGRGQVGKTVTFAGKQSGPAAGEPAVAAAQ